MSYEVTCDTCVHKSVPYHDFPCSECRHCFGGNGDDDMYIEIEHEALMANMFPDYPCIKCKKKCTAFKSCTVWHYWFTKTWNKFHRD